MELHGSFRSSHPARALRRRCMSEVSAAKESSQVSTPAGAALGSSNDDQGVLKTYCGVLLRIDAAAEELASNSDSPSATEAAWRAMSQVHLQAALVASSAVRIEGQQLRDLFDAAHFELQRADYAFADLDGASDAWIACTGPEAETMTASIDAHDWSSWFSGRALS
jgi:hypothetical protein